MMIMLIMMMLMMYSLQQVRDYADKILNEAEDIEMLKKHEQEKVDLLKENNNENLVDDDMEQVREEMMKERSKRLQEHQENLSATIAKLQIEKAKQVRLALIEYWLLVIIIIIDKGAFIY